MADGITRRMFGGLASGGIVAAPSLMGGAQQAAKDAFHPPATDVGLGKYVNETYQQEGGSEYWLKRELEEELEHKSRGYQSTRLGNPINEYIRADVRALRSVSPSVKDRIIMSRIEAADKKSWEHHINKRIDELRAKLGILGALLP